jgi:cell division protein FtsQ
MLKKTATILFYIMIPVGVFVLLGFATEGNRSMHCREFHVKISGKDGNNFVDSITVVKQVYTIFDSLPGQSLRNFSLKTIENLVNEMYYVESSQAYRTIDGKVKVNIQQREPLARVINSYNESFYLDVNGRMMKTTNRYAARVMVVTGYIPARYSPVINLTDKLPQNESSKSEALMRELFTLVNYIDQNSFLKAWIDQVFVTRSGGFELIPKNGVHVIEFGDTTDMEEKFDKLLVFYRNGLTQIGWNNYKRINLKYKNQIVCSK